MDSLVRSVLALTLIVILVGCGSGHYSASLSGKPQPQPEQVEQLTGLTPPAELLGDTPVHMASVQLVEHTGDGFMVSHGQRVSVEGTSARFDPAWTAGTPGVEMLAYAIYGFNLAGYVGVNEIVLDWEAEPTDYANLWIGLGNWNTNCWDWFACDSSNILSFTETGYGEYAHPLTGDLVLAVIMLGTQQSLLTKLQVGERTTFPIEITGITPDPAHGYLNLELMLDVQFIGTDDATTSYAWNFGGGATPNESTERRPTVITEALGTYSCTITVDNDYGDPQTHNFTLTVTNERGDWWMIGRNAQHQARSPFIGAQTNNLKWTFDTSKDSYSSPVLAADGTIYFGNSGGHLYAVNPDGSEKWVYFSEGHAGIIHSAPAIGTDGAIYFACGDTGLYSCNANGTLRWKATTAPDSIVDMASPAIATDGTIYFGSTDGNVMAFKPGGQRKWIYSTGDMVLSSPVIGEDGTIYVGSDDDSLHAITPEGTEKWLFATGDNIRCSPAIGPDGTIFFGSMDNNLYAIDQDGDLIWSYPLALNGSSSPVIAADGTIYIGSTDNKFCAISSTGELQWEFPTGGEFGRSVPAIGADGTIYVGCDDFSVYALYPNGSLKWSHTTGDFVRTSPAIGPYGTVYVSSLEGPLENRLYAFGVDDPHGEGGGESL